MIFWVYRGLSGNSLWVVRCRMGLGRLDRLGLVLVGCWRCWFEIWWLKVGWRGLRVVLDRLERLVGLWFVCFGSVVVWWYRLWRLRLLVIGRWRLLLWLVCFIVSWDKRFWIVDILCVVVLVLLFRMGCGFGNWLVGCLVLLLWLLFSRMGIVEWRWSRLVVVILEKDGGGGF